MKTIKRFEIRTKRVKIAEDRVPYGEAMREPRNVADAASRLLSDESQEVFLVFLLDIKNRIMGYTETARGGVDSCAVDPRMVFRAAVVQGASGIIVAHNHPSGDPEPSSADNALTERLIKCGKMLGLPVLDHVVIGDGDRYSYREHRGELF